MIEVHGQILTHNTKSIICIFIYVCRCFGNLVLANIDIDVGPQKIHSGRALVLGVVGPLIYNKLREIALFHASLRVTC